MYQLEQMKLKDPTFFQENRLEAHSSHECFPEEIALNQRANSYRLLLNGIWKFQYARNDESYIVGFEAAEYNCKNW